MTAAVKQEISALNDMAVPLSHIYPSGQTLTVDENDTLLKGFLERNPAFKSDLVRSAGCFSRWVTKMLRHGGGTVDRRCDGYVLIYHLSDHAVIYNLFAEAVVDPITFIAYY